VQGIHAINERQLGEEGTPGRVTARLAEVFVERQDELLS
jgi:branched-chain amino acid aminotransferase